VEHNAATISGPVNALDNAIRKALEKFYPQPYDMESVDYKMRGLIESGDSGDKWRTVGVPENVIEDNLQALVDSINDKLLKDKKTRS
jgi:2-isopropylmalate synthase